MVIDVVVCGIDIECISFVVNYDILFDVEFYVYCIGCIGCVGCFGCVLLFVELCECCLLCNIEYFIKKLIDEVVILNYEILMVKRCEKFKVCIEL